MLTKEFKKTPHINILDDIGFGKTVLMPGDPLRAKFIADNFLEDAVLVNNVRGVNGYTGYYKGVKVSVMASGMGMPSIGIYSNELYRFFDVENIIRVGSAGSLSPKCDVNDVVIATGACTNSNYANQFKLNGSISAVADFTALSMSSIAADNCGLKPKFGLVLSSDVFYNDYQSSLDWTRVGCIATEMEAAALYYNAAMLDKKALTICTVSDLCYPPFTEMDATARQNTFINMINLALETAVLLENK